MLPVQELKKNSRKRTCHRHLPETVFRVIGRLSAAYFTASSTCYVIRIRLNFMHPDQGDPGRDDGGEEEELRGGEGGAREEAGPHPGPQSQG